MKPLCLTEITPCECGKTPKLYYCGLYQLKCKCGYATPWVDEGRSEVIRIWNTMRYLGV